MLSPLQKIAINRVEGRNHYLIQWWTKKYNRPPNHPLLTELTWEELYVDYLADYYAENPEEISKAKGEYKEWDGKTSENYEAAMKERLAKIPKVDLSKWTQDVEKDEDEFEDDFQQGVKDGKEDD